MRQDGVVKVLEFHRDDPDGRTYCQISVCNDGSVYVRGRDVPSIFEESSDAAEKAVRFVESKGYVRNNDSLESCSQ